MTYSAKLLVFIAFGLLCTINHTYAQNVGVDVATPVEKLDVLGAIHIGTTANTNAGTIRYSSPNFQGYDGTQWVNFGGSGGLTGSGTATRVAFWSGTSALSSNANLYWNNSSSSLGIGTNTPIGKLHIEGAGELLRITSTAENSTLARFYVNSTPRLDFTSLASTGSQLTLFDGVGTYATRISGGGPSFFRFGNVGIGTDTPAEKLDVIGKTKTTTFQMTTTPTVNYVLRSDAAGNASWVDPNTLVSVTTAWKLTGNASTLDNGTNFIGTTDNIPLTIKVNGQKSGRIDHLLFNAYWGYKAGSATTSGNYNTALGDQALQANTTGQLNTAIGNSTLFSNLGGSNNIAIGGQALYTNTSGFENIAIGWQAMYFNVNGQGNTAMGWKALFSNVSGTQNAAYGSNALYSHTSGSFNAAFGYDALYYNKSGNNGVALGFRSQYYAYNTTSGWDNANTSVGYQSLMGSTSPGANTGNYNTAMGRNTLFANASGANNTAVGYTAGDINTSGSNNTYLGYNADASANNLSNATAIGANAVVAASNSLVLGNAAKVGIGTSSPIGKLHIEGADELLRITSTTENSTLSRIYINSTPRLDLTSFAATGAQLTLYDGAGTYATRIGSGGPSYFRFGNVGIGTDTPAEKLEVFGKTKTTNFQMTTTPTVNYVLRSDAAGNASWVDPNTLVTGGSGGTLDDAYDFGGAGAGRVITADAGAVEINGVDGFITTGTMSSGTIPATGPGTRMMWYPTKAAFRAGHVQNNEWNDADIGEFSFASGVNNTASGVASFAMGNGSNAINSESTAFGLGTTASGSRSTAMGMGTVASGNASTAMGDNTLASGEYSLAGGAFTTASGFGSTAMGFRVTAESAYEFAIGSYNTDYAPNNPTGWNVDDRLFVIGNGYNSGTESNAMVVLKSGNTGLGTSTPDATLDLVGTLQYVDGNEGTGKVLTSDASGNATWEDANGSGTLDYAYDFGGAGLGRTITADAGAVEINGVDGFIATGTLSSGTIPANGAGIRMMWYPGKAAFRAGLAYNLEWDDANTGSASVATGAGTIASGDYSTAMGFETSAIGAHSTALGAYTYAAGTASTSIGLETNAPADYSTAMGYQTTASGDYSTAMGAGSTASGDYSTAIGYQTTASGHAATSMGFNASTNNFDGSFVIGDFTNSTVLLSTEVNQFSSRFEGGYRFYSDPAMNYLTGLFFNSGNLGIGTFAPGAKLEVDGQVKIVDGTEGAGKVLTSDANGLAAWETPSGGSGSAWELTGNAGTVDDGTNFIGTTDDIPLTIRVNGEKAARLESDTWVGDNYANSFYGYLSGNSNTNGSSNSTNGIYTLTNNSTGGDNTAMGAYALYLNSDGNGNTAIGNNALFGNSSGYQNTAIGIYAMQNNTTGNQNTASGIYALADNTVGNRNTASGLLALKSNVAGSNAVAIGTNAMFYANSTTTPFTNSNVAVGFEALRGSITASANTGNFNTAVGYQTMQNNTSGSGNAAYGNQALYSNTTGFQNTANGNQALNSNTTGFYNTANGNWALQSNTTGFDNTANGHVALSSNTTGNYNTANGHGALSNNLAGSNATAFGTNAMQYANNTTTPFTNSNVAVGYEALRGSTTASANTGNFNTAVGYQTLQKNTTGYRNCAFGYLALNTNIDGAYNVASGPHALFSNTSGWYNTANGREALYYNTTGSNNTANGVLAGAANTIGSSNTFIGWLADASANNLDNATAIGANAYVGQSNTVVLGSINGVNSATVSAKVGIGDNTPSYPLEVSGTVATGVITTAGQHFAAATTTWTNQTTTRNVSIKANGTIWATAGFISASDVRAKENISSLSPATSIELINKINPVNYNWIDKSKSGSSMETGFIAQEIEVLYPAAISKGIDVLPNIVSFAKVENQTATTFSICLNKDAAINTGDNVKIITAAGAEQMLPVTEVNNGLITFAKQGKDLMEDEVFVYGVEVHDFRTVDYNQIFTLNVSATQELSKQLKVAQAEIEALKNENSNLKTESSTRVNAMQAQIDMITEHLNMKTEK
ncbi:MAG: beta strand repeat-containing protein [Bacteroidia bacterium]